MRIDMEVINVQNKKLFKKEYMKLAKSDYYNE